MKLYDQIKSIINLNEVELPKSIQKSVGNVLLGANPKIAKLQNKPLEKDTPKEIEIINNLKNWTAGSTDSTEKAMISTVADLQVLRQYFPEILNPPYGKKAYRGTSLKLKEIMNFIKKYPKYDVIEYDMIRFKQPYPYVSKREVNSWSTTPFFASSFQGKSFESADNVPVVFETKIDDTFIINPIVMNIIFKTAANEFSRDEDEIIKFDQTGTYYLILTEEEFELFNQKPSTDKLKYYE